MKKGLTILTAAFAASTLFSCKYTFGKVTGIKVQAIKYALNNKPYKISAIVEGEGQFSKEVTWTTSSKSASIIGGEYFYYKSGPTSEDKEVTITATSVRDKTKSDSVKINVIAAQELTQSEFKKLAENGDNEREALLRNYVDADHGDDDIAYFKDAGGPASVDYAQYNLSTKGWHAVELRHNGISKMKSAPIHTATQLDNAFNNSYKDCASWFKFNDEKHGECYGYCVDKPASSEEKSKWLYSVFQIKTGLPVYQTEYDDNVCQSYVNLTPRLS